MREFESMKKLLLSIIQYYIDYGYCHVQFIKYPEHKQDKYSAIDKKLSEKFNTDLNKGQRAYRKRKKQANAIALRCREVCLIMHTNGQNNWNEKFTDIREQTLQIPFGDTVKIDLKIIEGKGYVKYSKRSYQDIKEIIKDLARCVPIWKHKAELKKIKNLPAVRRQMHLQKEHLFDLYKRECKRHGKKPFML